jgi:predicted nuclease of predicted toxin-antitoxin system
VKLLAGENIDRPIAAWLREQGHDVIELAVAAPGATDEAVVQMAHDEERVLLTFDRDIGWILRSLRVAPAGAVYLRLRGSGRELWRAFAEIWPRVESVAPGRFVIVRHEQVVVRQLPSRGDTTA